MKKIVLTTIMMLIIATSALKAQTIYVKADATGNNTGSSWTNAYVSLQTALENAGVGNEIWVAAGTYRPSINAGNGTDIRDKAFVLVPSVKIYGGFAGTESSLAQRQLPPFGTSSPAILSGDLDEDGIFSEDDAYHVVISAGDVGTACLDGFTIIGGQSTDGTSLITVNEESVVVNRGGGIYNVNSSPTLTNLTIEGNTAGYDGGGMYSRDNSTPILTHITIRGNTSMHGGGMTNYRSSPKLNDVSIYGNTATNVGGGISNYYSYVELTDVDIYGNFAEDGGGIGNNNSTPILNNVTIRNNSASNNGGGMWNGANSSPELFNVTINENTAVGGGGIYNLDNSSPELYTVIIKQNTAENGGGVYNNNSSPYYGNCTINNNSATSLGGGMYNNNSSTEVYGTCINENSASDDGGGIYNKDSSPQIIRVTICGNTADFAGGIYNYNSSPTLVSTLISGNVANYQGGGMCNSNDAKPKLINVTLCGNVANESGGAMKNNGTHTEVEMHNTIILGNDEGVVDSNGSSTSYSHCLVQDINPPGTGNLNGTTTYPIMFENAVGYDQAPTTAGDYRLAEGSPCIDVGDNSINMANFDLHGNQRKNGIIDLGAYEFYTSYTVTFNSMGGSDVPSVVVAPGELVPQPEAPIKDEYDFNGWFTDVSYTVQWDFDTDVVLFNMTLYAKWTPKVGIEDFSNTALAIYPNPTTNIVNISGICAGDKISVMDLSGRKLMEVRATGTVQTLDIGNLRAGVYIIGVGNRIGKLVIN